MPDEVPGGGAAEMGLDLDRRAAREQVADHWHLLRPDRGDQRREPDGGRLQVDERTRVEQQLGDVDHASLGGEVERRGAHGAVDGVNVGARREQFADHLRRAPPGGEHQRGQRQRPAPIDVGATPDEPVRRGQIVVVNRRE